MTRAEQDRLKSALIAFASSASANEESAKAALRKTGIFTRSGKVAANYGGPTRRATKKLLVGDVPSVPHGCDATVGDCTRLCGIKTPRVTLYIGKGLSLRTKTNYEKVREFHKAFGQPLDKGISIPVRSLEESNLISLRLTLIHEEHEEVSWAKSSEELLKELTDLLYVVYGFAATFGWDIDTAFNRVHASNMSKLDDNGKPIYREDGKVLKSKNYQPPDLSDLV